MFDSVDTRIPATLLTGALGSGKTTLLNRILSEQHGIKFGVIVNEFGELSIDHHLVVGTEEDVVELANGCVCCTVREDLLDAVVALLKRQELDYLLIETTGLADPRPVAQTFLHEEVCEDIRLDAIVTVIDAENFHLNMANSGTAIDQILAGDILLLNKTDLVSEEAKREIRDEIEDINPAARLIETVQAHVDLRLLLDVDLHRENEQEVAQTEGDFVSLGQLVSSVQNPGSHLSREEISSVSFSTTAPLSNERLTEFLENLPRNIFRGKGILWIEGFEDQLIFHLVGDRATATVGEPWGDGVRESKLVLIGKQLEKESLVAALETCVEKTLES